MILVDLICHGTPSPGLFKLHLGYIERMRKSRVVSYAHRPKWNGWGHFESFTLANGKEERGTPLANSWRDLFYSNKLLRPTCCRCPFTVTDRQGDLTIADFWGIERSSRPGLKDRLGVSLLLANTDCGVGMVRDAMDAGLLQAWPMTLAEAMPGNPMLEHPSSYEGDRCDPWETLYGEGYDRMLRKCGFHQNELSYYAQQAKRKVKLVLKRALGR